MSKQTQVGLIGLAWISATGAVFGPPKDDVLSIMLLLLVAVSSGLAVAGLGSKQTP